MKRANMANKKRSVSKIVGIVICLSLLLLVIRLAWVLPAAFNHHQSKNTPLPTNTENVSAVAPASEAKSPVIDDEK